MIVLFPIIIVIAAIGLIIKIVLDYISKDRRIKNKITWFEYIVILVVCSFIIAPATIALWNYLSFRSKVEYREYWNGWETGAHIETTVCHKNGSCKHTYECDPHEVSYSCNCHPSCTGSGSSQSCTESCDTCYQTEYDNCPYCDNEYDYIVDTTLGSFIIDTHRFPENPNDHRWRESEHIPDSVIQYAGVGAPDFWNMVDKRLKAGNPGPATQIKIYDNYIYASDNSILKQYSGSIDKYKKLLPTISSGVHDFYLADKVYFVGCNTPDRNMWIERLNYLNAAVGSELQGDIHLIIVGDSIKNPDEYVIALQSYWQDKKFFGKSTLPKNTIVIILGTDGKKIVWGRAFTGMPTGNKELMTDVMNNFRGANFTVDSILGSVHKEKGQIVHTLGLLESSIYGYRDRVTKFKRVSMQSKDKGDNGTGFLYLQNEIVPSTSSRIWCMVFCIFLSCIGWTIAVFVDMDNILNSFRKTLRR